MKYLSQQRCRTTRRCWHEAFTIKDRGWVSIKKDSHTVGFGLAEGRRYDGQPTWGVGEGQLTLRYPSHKS